jgi:iron complex outermembrane receptor protein
MAHVREIGVARSLPVLACACVLGASMATAQTATGPAPAAHDDSALGEIVVTAQRRAEREADVPISITTISAQELKDTDARQLTDIQQITPGLRFDANGPFTQPTIRGVGTAVAESGGGADVGIYIDGFYSPNPLSVDSQLLNVESVQVLKGPQGTLFGPQHHRRRSSHYDGQAEPGHERNGRGQLRSVQYSAV